MASDRDSIDANTRHQIYVERLAATNANTLDPELKKLATWLRGRLADEGGSISSQAALKRIVRDVKAVFGTTYTNWGTQTAKFFNDLAAYETGFQTELLNSETVEEYTAKQPTQKSSKELTVKTPMMIGANGGAVFITDMVKNFSPTNTKKATDLIVAGFHNGSTTSAIADSIIGTKKNQRKDGVLIKAKQAATSLSKTGANHVSNTSKSNVYQENERAVQGYQLAAVLDRKTSTQCRFWDSKEVRFDDQEQPSPPFHPNCRTVKIPLLRPDLNRVKNSEQLAHGSGKPKYESTNLQYYSWLQRQSKEFQIEVLGPTQAAIFRGAGLSAADFRKATMSKQGEPLTIEQMRVKDSRIADYLAGKE